MASNIRVALTLDNKKYISDLKTAERAGDTFAKNTRKSTESAEGAFKGLGAAIAAIGIGALVKTSITLAAQLDNMARATGIAVERISAFQSAMIGAGGSSDRAVDAISDLTKNMGEAALGSTELQKSFNRVGVSMEDIRSLSNEDILKKVLSGLKDIPDRATRTATAFKLMGESVKGVDINSLNAGLGQFAGSASAIEAAAGAQTSLATNFNNLNKALIEVLEPLNKLVAGINISIEAFSTLIKIVAAVGASFLIFGKVLPLLQSSTNAGYKMVTSFGGLGKQVSSLGGHLSRMIGHLGRVITGGGEAASRMASFGLAISQLLKFFARFAGIAGIIYAVVTAVNALVKAFTGFDLIDEATKKISKFIDKAKEFFGLSSGAGAGRGDGAAELKQRAKDLAAAAEKKLKEEAAKAELAKKLVESAARIALSNDAAAKSLENSLFAGQSRLDVENQLLDLQTRGISIGQYSAAAQMAQYDIELQRLSAMSDINGKIKEASLAYLQMTDKTAEAALIQLQIISGLEGQKASIDDIYTRHGVGMLKLIERNENLKTIEEARVKNMEAMFEAIDKAAERQQSLGDSLQGANSQLVAVQFEGSQSGLGPLEKQLNSIKEQGRLAASEASKAFSAMFPDDVTPEQGYELAAGVNAIADAYKQITDAQLANVNASRTWSAGIKESLAAFADDAGNSAKQAQTYFETFTQGAEDAFVKFVQTGKLSFKDLANSLIADFARIQAKKALAGLFGGSGGGGGDLFGSIGKIFGFANGGNPAMGKPIIVGENGPELMVPRNASSIIPNGALGGGGGQTYVTYNIQATDAQSFKQQLARDPSFVHAVVEQGRRSTPGGARR